MNPITRAGALAVLLANDFWYIHLYSKDEDFDKSHKLTDQYYHNLSYEGDDLMELAIQEGYDILNPNTVSQVFPEYIVESGTSYSYFDVVQRAKEKLSLYIDALKQVRNSTNKTDIQSKIDSMLEFWNKEVSYRLARRSDTPSMLNGFINTGFDNALAYVVGGGR